MLERMRKPMGRPGFNLESAIFLEGRKLQDKIAQGRTMEELIHATNSKVVTGEPFSPADKVIVHCMTGALLELAAEQVGAGSFEPQEFQFSDQDIAIRTQEILVQERVRVGYLKSQ